MNKEYLEKCLGSGMSTREISCESGKSRSDIDYWIHKHGIENLSVYKKRPRYEFKKIDTKEKAYILGFILADGSINQKNNVEITVSMKDREVVDFIAPLINAQVTVSNVFDKKTRRFPSAKTIKNIKDVTRFTGGFLKKDRHYPRVRDDLEKYMIQGFFDGDGCLTWGRRKDRNRIWQKISITSQPKLLLGIQQYLLNKVGIATQIHPKTGCDCSVLEFANRQDVLKFCEHIYSDSEFIILHRKYSKYKALRLELEENGGSFETKLYRAEPAEQEGVETTGILAIRFNNQNSIQGQQKAG